MGNWNITIIGQGCHHNTRTDLEGNVSVVPQDANVMAAEFVELLKKRGHTIIQASFTHGGTEDIKEEQYLKNYKPEGAKVG